MNTVLVLPVMPWTMIVLFDLSNVLGDVKRILVCVTVPVGLSMCCCAYVKDITLILQRFFAIVFNPGIESRYI